MIQSLRVAVLAENTAGARGVRAEHGFSLWIEADGKHVLFDTGQGLVLGANADFMGADLSLADAIVLSHGHYDHTGGLMEATERAQRAKLYVHPRAFESKYHALPGGGGADVGAASGLFERIEARGADVVATAEPTQVLDGVWATGEIPRRNDFEDTGGPFFLDQPCTRPDALVDDQALFFETEPGTTVFLGCGHAGLINTLDYVSVLTEGRKIHAVYGGLHLAAASEHRIERTLEALRRHDVRRLGPAHCTGPEVVERMRAEFGDRFARVRAGVRFTIE